MWLTNGGTASLVAVLVKTDEGAESVYRNMTTFLVENTQGLGEVETGLTIPGKIEKMGATRASTPPNSSSPGTARLPGRSSAGRRAAASTR
jgi:alkylation response protein AidB-like acyl-CoA dehydrogenase